MKNKGDTNSKSSILASGRAALDPKKLDQVTGNFIELQRELEVLDKKIAEFSGRVPSPADTLSSQGESPKLSSGSRTPVTPRVLVPQEVIKMQTPYVPASELGGDDRLDLPSFYNHRNRKLIGGREDASRIEQFEVGGVPQTVSVEMPQVMDVMEDPAQSKKFKATEEVQAALRARQSQKIALEKDKEAKNASATKIQTSFKKYKLQEQEDELVGKVLKSAAEGYDARTQKIAQARESARDEKLAKIRDNAEMRGAYNKLTAFARQKREAEDVLKKAAEKSFHADLTRSFDTKEYLKPVATILAGVISDMVVKDKDITALDMKENQFFYDAIIYSAIDSKVVKDFVSKNKDKANFEELFKQDKVCMEALTTTLKEAKEKGNLHHQVFYHKDSKIKQKGQGMRR